METEKEDWNIGLLRQSLEKKMAGVERTVREGMEMAGTDYRRFFEWKADDVYQACLLRDHYRLFRNRLERADGVQGLKRYFEDIARYHQERLVGCRPARHSTNPMADMAHTLSLECSQRLMQDCLNFAHILSLRPPGQEVKEGRREETGLKRKPHGPGM